MGVSRSTYDEMIAAGVYARISNADLKNELTAFYTYAESMDGMLQYFRTDLGRASDILWRHVAFSTDDDGSATLTDYDFESLCRNVEVRNAMVEVIDSRGDWLGSARQFIRMLESIEALLTDTAPSG